MSIMTDPTTTPPAEAPDEASDPLERLTVKQRQFVFYYCGSAAGNGTRAARMAGYSGDANTLSSMAWENLRKPDIKAAIEAELERLAMDEREILWRISQHARADLGEFLDTSTPGRALVELSGEEKPLHLLKKVKQKVLVQGGDEGVEVLQTEIEVVDSQAALRDLARIKGLFKDNLNVTADVTISGEEVDQAARRGREKARKWREEREGSGGG